MTVQPSRGFSRENRWQLGRALRAWLSSRLFARQLADFLLLWLVFKGANGFTAIKAGLSPLGFRPGTEAVALTFECLALFVFMRRDRETLLLASLGLDLPLILLPFALLHTTLSLALSAFA
ncbi:MAG TPA: hypothetical protein VKP10_18125 [Gemmatimonadales bacterium]|nr:hypothetical protein [Gemmatimonadales bacterium]